jgi:predicted enzyme related to lactoylglutathione lyase
VDTGDVERGLYGTLYADYNVCKRRKFMANPFVHIELHTQDPEKAKKFYTGLFDWTLEDYPDMSYTIIKVGEGTGGGMMKSPIPDALPQWVPYILVDDVAASTEKAKSLGATILEGVTEIPDMGWFSMLLDPTGAAFALWKPNMPA